MLRRLVGMADEVDSKSIGGNTVRVQVPQPALHPWQGIGLKITYLRYFWSFFLLKKGTRRMQQIPFYFKRDTVLRYHSIILSGRSTPAAWPHGPLYSPLSPASAIALCILRLLFRRHPATWNATLQNIYSPAC